MQLLAYIDALLRHWPTVRQLIGGEDPRFDRVLYPLVDRLRHASSVEELKDVLDDLFDLAEASEAKTYVRDLLARNTLELPDEPVRRGVSFAPTEPVWLPGREKDTVTAGAELATAMQEPFTPETVPVYYATNRRPVDDAASSPRFGGELLHGLSLGLAHATIPLSARATGFARVPRWWNRHRCDPERFITLLPLQSMGESRFLSQLANEIDAESGGDLLVFLHGYNVDFEEAARSAAQLAFNLSFKGVVVLFSWPSQGTLPGYWADEARAGASGESLAQLLELLVEGPWKKVHILAHSMGNRVMVSALADSLRSMIPLGQVVFVAADVYVETFRAKYPKMADAGLQKTSYVSSKDRALWFSNFLHQAERIGYPVEQPFVMDGLETLEASPFNTGSLLGHSYFSEKRAVLTDLGYLLHKGLAAADRDSLRPMPGKSYWTFAH